MMIGPGITNWEWKKHSYDTFRNECLLDFHEAYRYYRQCKEGKKSAITLYRELYHDKCKSVCPLLTKSMNINILGSEEQVRYKKMYDKYQLGYRLKAEPFKYNNTSELCCTIM